jgi:hypothetical protein
VLPLYGVTLLRLHTLQIHVLKRRGRSLWSTRHATIDDVSLMDLLVDEARSLAITSPGASTFLDGSPHYHPMNTGAFTLAISRSLIVAYFPLRRCALV